MKQFAILFVVVVLCAPAFGQEFLSSDGDCYIDKVTGEQYCPKLLKATAAVAGAAVSKVGAAITPNSVALPVQPMQAYSLPIQSAPVQSQYQSWSKSWSRVPGQPVRNLGRRIFGR